MTEAERLAKELEEDFNLSYPSASMYEAAAELLRLHAINSELVGALESIAEMYDYETSTGELASRLYEAKCVANFVLSKAKQ